MQCLVRLAKTKFEELQRNNPDEDDPLHRHIVQSNYDKANPFRQCLTCKENFSFGDRCHVALLKECLGIYSEEIDLYFCQTALTSIIEWCHVLFQKGRVEDAKVFLIRKIEVFRKVVNNGENRGIDTSLFTDTLAELLKCLASAHEKTKMLVWMKNALDEALSLCVDYEPEYMIKAELVRYTYLTGDIGGALAGAEALLLEARQTDAHVRKILLLCAPLNFMSGDKERCLEQYAEAAKHEAVSEKFTTWLTDRIRDDENIKCAYRRSDWRIDWRMSCDWLDFTIR